MNIIFYSSCYPPKQYGVSRSFDNFSRALALRGHAVAVVTAQMPGWPDQEEKEGVRIFRIAPANRLRSAAAADKIIQIARELKTELIQGVDYLGECAPLIRRTDRPPICIKISSSISLRMLRRSLAFYAWQKPIVALACLRSWRQWRAELFSMHKADFLMAPSHKVFLELERQGAALAPIRAVIPNPVEILESWQNAEDASPMLLYVGRLDFGKGVGSLPAILKAVRSKVPDVRLTVAGGDSYARGVGSVRAWMVRHFAENIDRVHFTDELDSPQLDEYFRRAWVVVVPSRWDCFPNATLEAMARAKPVVVSSNGGMPELVQGTDAPIADQDSPDFSAAISALLVDLSKRNALGLALRRRAIDYFNPDLVVDAYCRFVQERSLGGRLFASELQKHSGVPVCG